MGMRRRGELLVTGLVAAGLLSACGGGEGDAESVPQNPGAATSASPSPTGMHLIIEATISNTRDRTGAFVGVDVYGGPQTNALTGHYNEGQSVEIVCLEPEGRRVVDDDVPPGQPAIDFNDWYKLDTPPGPDQWLGAPFATIVGSVAVPSCGSVPTGVSST